MTTRASGSTPTRRSPGTVQQSKRHPDSSKKTTLAQNLDATSSQKQAPTHPKSTKTPITCVPKQQSKRPTPSDTAHKPTLTRRNTFDDPSSPSTTQNSRVSHNPTPRISALSSKTAATQKASPARKQSSQQTKPVGGMKKRFIYVEKQDIGISNAETTKEQCTSSLEKIEVSDAHEDVPQPQQNLIKDQESSSIGEAREDQAIDQVGSSNETKPDVLLPVDPEPISSLQTKPENGKDVDFNHDKQNITPAVETVISSIDQEVSKEHDINEIKKIETDEDHVADNPTSEVRETDKEAARTVLTDHKKEAVGNESDLTGESKETEPVQEEKWETEKVAAKTLVVVKGKKLESGVSNDVIEETARNLREQRKNKVRALAGAFETVISLQEQK